MNLPPTVVCNVAIHKLCKTQFWNKLFTIGFPYKHCNFLPLCLVHVTQEGREGGGGRRGGGGGGGAWGGVSDTVQVWKKLRITEIKILFSQITKISK